MFEKLKKFWDAFWQSIRTAYNKAFRYKVEDDTQSFRDTKHINFLSVFVAKLNNLANIESTYEIESDSTQTEELKRLCKDIEANRFDIVSEMLGTGDFWVFPAHDKNGKLYHRYISSDKVQILNMDGDKVTDVIGIIDEYVDDKNNIYYFNRRHTLDNGTLYIETYTTDDNNKRKSFEAWEEYNNITYQLTGAEHIGVGRFKSPTSSRGLSPIYGVALNFGCEEIEKKIFHTLELIENEFNNAESKIFTDPRNLVRDEKTGEYKILDNIFAVQTRAGTNGANIDIYAPSIRYAEFQAKLFDDMRQYEQLVGTDRGFLTPFESGNATTATEIRRANASTIALIDKIHTAIKNGVEMCLKADAVFLNIAPDLYTVTFDFFDAFEDSDKQYERLVSAVDRGTAEKSDEIKWLFPNLSQEEIDEKLARISAEKQIDTESAIESIIGGGGA